MLYVLLNNDISLELALYLTYQETKNYLLAIGKSSERKVWLRKIEILNSITKYDSSSLMPIEEKYLELLSQNSVEVGSQFYIPLSTCLVRSALLPDKSKVEYYIKYFFDIANENHSYLLGSFTYQLLVIILTARNFPVLIQLIPRIEEMDRLTPRSIFIGEVASKQIRIENITQENAYDWLRGGIMSGDPEYFEEIAKTLNSNIHFLSYYQLAYYSLNSKIMVDYLIEKKGYKPYDKEGFYSLDDACSILNNGSPEYVRNLFAADDNIINYTNSFGYEFLHTEHISQTNIGSALSLNHLDLADRLLSIYTKGDNSPVGWSVDYAKKNNLILPHTMQYLKDKQLINQTYINRMRRLFTNSKLQILNPKLYEWLLQNANTEENGLEITES
jgi:hypothetical protein